MRPIDGVVFGQNILPHPFPLSLTRTSWPKGVETAGFRLYRPLPCHFHFNPTVGLGRRAYTPPCILYAETPYIHRRPRTHPPTLFINKEDRADTTKDCEEDIFCVRVFSTVARKRDFLEAASSGLKNNHLGSSFTFFLAR